MWGIYNFRKILGVKMLEYGLCESRRKSLQIHGLNTAMDPTYVYGKGCPNPTTLFPENTTSV